MRVNKVLALLVVATSLALLLFVPIPDDDNGGLVGLSDGAPQVGGAHASRLTPSAVRDSEVPSREERDSGERVPTLLRTTFVCGRVLDQQTRNPIAGACIYDRQAGSVLAVADELGGFCVDAGTVAIDLKVTADGYDDEKVSVSSLSAAGSVLVFLKSKGAVTIRCQWPNEAPAGGVVILLGEDGAQLAVTDQWGEARVKVAQGAAIVAFDSAKREFTRASRVDGEVCEVAFSDRKGEVRIDGPARPIGLQDLDRLVEFCVPSALAGGVLLFPCGRYQLDLKDRWRCPNLWEVQDHSPVTVHVCEDAIRVTCQGAPRLPSSLWAASGAVHPALGLRVGSPVQLSQLAEGSFLLPRSAVYGTVTRFGAPGFATIDVDGAAIGAEQSAIVIQVKEDEEIEVGVATDCSSAKLYLSEEQPYSLLGVVDTERVYIGSWSGRDLAIRATANESAPLFGSLAAGSVLPRTHNIVDVAVDTACSAEIVVHLAGGGEVLACDAQGILYHPVPEGEARRFKGLPAGCYLISSPWAVEALRLRMHLFRGRLPEASGVDFVDVEGDSLEIDGQGVWSLPPGEATGVVYLADGSVAKGLLVTPDPLPLGLPMAPVEPERLSPCDGQGRFEVEWQGVAPKRIVVFERWRKQVVALGEGAVSGGRVDLPFRQISCVVDKEGWPEHALPTVHLSAGEWQKALGSIPVGEVVRDVLVPSNIDLEFYWSWNGITRSKSFQVDGVGTELLILDER